ncbi:hypothetical protein [Metallosphaera javensis (ex Sakai et al. 2022)]|uniref:hypothetical protein n=1 Tax=Metallosphaera javensis (ex Sakai et al. 2022) TaxID=2775498 RepID=UPI00258C2A1B|nr:MAG: uncharacterized membrane-anchored protein SSO0840 [Metallosphaera javensis (ex Sakai et al. 2022)]
MALTRAILLSLFLAFLASLPALGYSIQVNYPSNVLLGQNFTVSFSLVSNLINSTNFQYMTPGTKLVNVSGKTAYEGFGLYWMIGKINVSDSSQITISFEGTIVGSFSGAPGIVLYGNNFTLSSRDGQPGTYEILVGWNGGLYLDKLGGWNGVLGTLPSFYSGNYTVIFKDVNSSVCVYSIAINSSVYMIEYNTGIPWKDVGYAGLRLDTDTVLPLSFQVLSFIPSNYVVYLDGKVFKSGFSNGTTTLSLRVFSPSTLNISFPGYHIYKVITISTSNGDIHEEFPIVQIALIIVTGILIGLSAWKEIVKGRSK